MKTREIRKLFLDYFQSKQHEIIESSALIPDNDNTLLFTNAGMVQFKNIFTGLETRAYVRATTSQKCLRAGGKHNDLENVGFTARHHTFFEMLGNFSFGDYFKEQAIEFSWDFLTNHLKLPKEKLLVTVYHTDDEAFDIWKKVSQLPDEKIIRISTKDNFWEMGEFGPCGPCSEIFYDHGEHIFGGVPGSEHEDGDRYVEIWNLVFMQYEKLPSGETISLSKPSIDTGMGLERIAAVMQNVQDNYDIDIFASIIKEIEKLLGITVIANNEASFKVIADHIRAAVFMVLDGVLPSNEGRGYILRRIIRRAVRHLYLLGAIKTCLYQLVDVVEAEMGDTYKEISVRKAFIIDTIKTEEEKFASTFENGIKILHEKISQLKSGDVLDGDFAFRLYDTFGFPVDLTEDIIKTYNISVDQRGFDEAFQRHRDLAKKSWVGGEKDNDKFWVDLSNKMMTSFVGYDTTVSDSEIIGLVKIVDNNLELTDTLNIGDVGYVILNQTPFYAEMGGQVGDTGCLLFNVTTIAIFSDTVYKHKLIVHKTENILHTINLGDSYIASVDEKRRHQISINHTAIHIVYDVLTNILGNHVTQQGALINERMARFDISHSKALTHDEIKSIELEVNKIILKNIPVVISSMPKQEAIEAGASALFGEKYPDIVRTVMIKENDNIYSFELCGGIHVKNTGEIGIFKIISDGSVGSGIRRIEAKCSFSALSLLQKYEDTISNLKSALASDIDNLLPKTLSLLESNRSLKKQLDNLSLDNHVQSILKNIVLSGEYKMAFYHNDDIESKDFKDISNRVLSHDTCNLVMIVSKKEDKKISFSIASSMGIDISVIGKSFVNLSDSITGGGNKNRMQGVVVLSDDISSVDDILNKFKLLL